MIIQPIVIGTAGHIDHGKSTLVQALTGVDPDRLKEERERGMTIDLGFAPLELPDGRVVGIVDVPGHERFIRNMVAGASGIDLVVLVVAADDGVMMQTREHLQIMQLLGVERGFVALTKVDMVEQELVDLAEEDVLENLVGTFLEDAPVMRVSAKTGEGMQELRELLFQMAMESQPRNTEGIFRMPVQRVFSKSGFGTVVTGVPVSGTAKVGDNLEVLPAGMRGKVRGLNAYKHSTQEICAGHSSAINFSDVDQHRVQRGDVVASVGFFAPQRMLAARFQALESSLLTVQNRMQIRLHTGTTDMPGEVILLDREELAPGETGLIQIRLKQAIICAPGDRYVLRLLSPVVTLGGGALLEESRYRLKRFRDFVLDGLRHQEDSLSTPAAHLESLLSRAGAEAVTTEELAVGIKRDKQETRQWLQELAQEERILSPSQDRWIHMDRLQESMLLVRRALDQWFEEQPHRTRIDIRTLRASTRFEAGYLGMVLESMVGDGSLEQLPGGFIRQLGREAQLSKEDTVRADEVHQSYTRLRFQPPAPQDLAQQLGVKAEHVQRLLEHLVDAERLQRVGRDMFMAREVLDEARRAVRENCQQHGQLEIPDLRDRLGTSRKYLIPILEFFDAEGLTIRQAGHRILRP